jgi:hypothetical protein
MLTGMLSGLGNTVPVPIILRLSLEAMQHLKSYVFSVSEETLKLQSLLFKQLLGRNYFFTIKHIIL